MNNLFRFRTKAFALIALLLVSFSSAFAQQKDTIAIINAGSSGSRLYVYAIDKENNTTENVFETEKNLKLSEIAAQKECIKAYMDAITSQYNPKDSIQLYVLATAGMRNDTLKENAPKIYDNIKKLKNIGKYQIKEAKTISGRYEGLYAWIAANSYLFTNESFKPDWKNTRGILEIGGASMQIAYIPEIVVENIKRDTINHRKYGVLYSKSYIQGGVNTVKKKTQGQTLPNYEPFAPELQQVPDSMVFHGLGGTIYGIGTKNVGSNFWEKTIDALKGNFKENAQYLQWVLKKLNLQKDDRIIPKKVDWTQGAAYDIFINDNPPEEFNYEQPN